MLFITIEKKKKFLINVSYVAVLVAAFYFSLKFCISYIFPFVLGIIIAVYIQYPAVLVSNKLKIPRGVSALILVILVYIAVLALISVFGVQIYSRLLTIYSNSSKYFNVISETANVIINKFNQLTAKFDENTATILANSLKNATETIITKVSVLLSESITNFASTMPQMLFSVVVTVITGCYVAADFEKLKQFLINALPNNYIKNILRLKNITYTNFWKIVKGYAVLYLITSAILFLGFAIFGFKTPLKTALFISIIDILPVFGIGTVMLPWALLLFLNAKYKTAIIVLVIYLTALIVRNILEPKLLGKSVGLHPVITLFLIFIGLRFFGIMGMFILPLYITVLVHYFKLRFVENESDEKVIQA